MVNSYSEGIGNSALYTGIFASEPHENAPNPAGISQIEGLARRYAPDWRNSHLAQTALGLHLLGHSTRKSPCVAVW